ncbi:10292_t:CDS:2 [Racocetra fulgida]|uniref:10292_t:CDS:1 n=1 Tax=Racocetra fulgida TaxID=60492 RepID=A0A9N8WHM3_9GLOM|nr:10292_t:CDS:2 [Racocetra fulgida]
MVVNNEDDAHNTVDSHSQSSKNLEWFFQALNEGRIIKFNYLKFINVKEIGQDPKTGDIIMVLQFAKDGNLRDYLTRQWNIVGFKISLTKIINILEQIVQGLKHLHTNNIIHRDLRFNLRDICDKIANGEREITIPGTPKDYVALYQKCWSTEPVQRPTLNKILECLAEISKEADNKFIIIENDRQMPQRHPSLPYIFPSSPNSIISSHSSVYFGFQMQISINVTNIITKSHAERIASWIYVNNIHNIRCEFKLLYTGNRVQDGPKFNGFYEKCGNKPRTVVVFRIRETGEIIGGYNPIEWKTAPRKLGMPSREYGKTDRGFIFSFKGDKSIYSEVKNTDKAIYYKDGFGPSWGKHDLSLRNDMAYNYKWYCKQKNYSQLIRFSAGSFDADDELRKDRSIRRVIFNQTFLFTIDIAQLLAMMVYREVGRFDHQLPTYLYAELFSTAFTVFVMTKFLDKIPKLQETVQNDADGTNNVNVNDNIESAQEKR